MFAEIPLAFLALLLPAQEEDRKLGSLIEALGADRIEERESAEAQLLNAGEKARLPLTKVARGTGEASIRARRVLRRLELVRVIPPHAFAVNPTLRDDLISPDDDVRRQALFKTLPKSAGNVQGPCRLALDDPDPAIRVQAALILEYDVTGAAHAEVMKFLMNPDSPNYAPLTRAGDRMFLLASNAGSRLWAWRRATPKEGLALLNSRSAYIRRQGFDVLRSLKYWTAADRVQEFLSDPDEPVVRRAVEFLKAAGLSDPEPYLKVIRSRDDQSVRDALRALPEAAIRRHAREFARLLPSKKHSLAREGLIRAAIRINPSLVEKEALDVIARIPGKGQGPYQDDHGDDGYFGYLAIAALHGVAACEKKENFEALLGGLRHLGRGPHKMCLELSGPEDLESLCTALAMCIPDDRVEDVVRFCGPSRMHYPEMRHARPDYLSRAGWGILRHLDPDAVADVCIQRALDGKLKRMDRQTACELLMGRSSPERHPKELKTLCALALGPKRDWQFREAVFDALPWHRPGVLLPELTKVLKTFLGLKDASLKYHALSRSVRAGDKRIRRIVLDALMADENLKIPMDPGAFGLAAKTPDPGLDELLEQRAKSKTPGVAAQALDFARSYYRQGIPENVSSIARAPTSNIKKPDPPSRKEILGIAARLKKTRDPLIAGRLLPEIARHAPSTASELIPWAVAHPNITLRQDAARAIGVGKFEKHFPSLLAMAVGEHDFIAREAIAAIRHFERPLRIQAYRHILRSPTYKTLKGLTEALVEEGAVELAPDLYLLLKHAGYQGASWARALDASMSPEAYRRWSEVHVELQRGSLEELVQRMQEAGLDVALSPRISSSTDLKKPLQDLYASPLGRALNGPGILFGNGHPIDWLCAASEGGKIRLMTVREAVQYWAPRFENKKAEREQGSIPSPRFNPASFS